MTALASETLDPSLGRPLPIKRSRIRPNPGQPRREFKLDSLQELAASIMLDPDHRTETPIKVIPSLTDKGFFDIEDGERRWRAYGLIENLTGKEPVIDCFISNGKHGKDQYRRSVIANLQREDMSPLDEAAALSKLYRDGMTHGELATMVGKSTSYVQNYIKLDSLPEAVKHYLRLDAVQKLTVTAAIDIARATKDPQTRIELAAEAVKRGLAISDIRYLIETKVGRYDDDEDRPKRAIGFDRKPSDVYKRYAITLSRSLAFLKRERRDVKLDQLYDSRPDEFADRKKDAETLRQIITEATAMAEIIERGLK